ncbi:hypothetical protein CW304_04220 [Bacillus sp. UFRGS-B20]|nr:hypothetical protein CW304_04220 [Bacillus sp. UFRGS-B20]
MLRTSFVWNYPISYKTSYARNGNISESTACSAPPNKYQLEAIVFTFQDLNSFHIVWIDVSR